MGKDFFFSIPVLILSNRDFLFPVGLIKLYHSIVYLSTTFWNIFWKIFFDWKSVVVFVDIAILSYSFYIVNNFFSIFSKKFLFYFIKQVFDYFFAHMSQFSKQNIYSILGKMGKNRHFWNGVAKTRTSVLLFFAHIVQFSKSKHMFDSR